jgi:hypothetical protein
MLQFAEGLPGNQCLRGPIGENMGLSKCAHGTFLLFVATCMASMPPVKAHRYEKILKKVGSFIGQQGEARGRPYGGLLSGCWCHDMGVNLAI